MGQTPSSNATARPIFQSLEPRLLLSVSAVPEMPDLVDAFDTGASHSDDITRLDNSDPTQSLTFSVSGAVAGATVTVYADSTAIGSVVASDGVALIATDGAYDLLDGAHAIAARQTEPGKTESDPSGALSVTVDTVSPSVPWGLDPNFDGDGKVTTDFATDSDEAYAVAIQSDGKIVVAGYSETSGLASRDFALARYNADGSLDTTFDGDGKVTTDFWSDTDCAEAVAIQSDGKIVVAGLADNGSDYEFALARYNADGSLDTSFDGDGKVTTDFGAGSDYAHALAIQSDGKIVAAGSASDAFGLVRYNTDGSLDTTFDGDGKLTTEFGAIDSGASALAIQSDGKIVVAGVTEVRLDHHAFALARYNADGSLDTTFDGDGKLTTDIGADGGVTSALAIQVDGKIVVAGTIRIDYYDADFALARYNTDGALDTSFDGDGKLTTDFGPGKDYSHDMVIQSDGKIVLVGYAYDNSYYDFALARYNADGSLDTSVGSDGKLTTTIGLSARAYAMAIHGVGTIVVAGYAIEGSSYDFALAQYGEFGIDLQAASDTAVSDSDNITGDDTPTFDVSVTAPYFRVYRDGSLISGDYESGSSYTAPVQPDGTWSYTVKAADEAGNESAATTALTVTIDTTVPTAAADLQSASDTGYSSTDDITNDNTPTFDVSVDAPYYRVYRDGTLISGLETGSTYTAPVQPDGTWTYAFEAADAAGKRTVDWTSLSVTIDTVAPPGSPWGLDPTFDGNGKVFTDFGAGDDEEARAMAIQADGKIVVAGYINTGNWRYDFALARYYADGTLDTTFDGDGMVTTDFGTDSDAAYAVAIQSDGKIVVAGGVSGDFALARYNPDGSLDTTFDSDGKVTTDLLIGSASANAVAIQSDGKIVLAGTADAGFSDFDFALVRYNPDGSLDTTFDGDGILTTDYQTDDDRAYSVAIQSDGKIVVAGEADMGSSDDFALARYNSDGSLDTTFDGDGKITTDFEASNDEGNALAVQSDGRIVVAGGGAGDFALARYNADGTLDTTFGGDGKLTTDFGAGSVAYAMAIQSDGKIVVAGRVYIEGDYGFALARYNADGSPDTSFDGDGKLTTGFGTDCVARAVAVQSDGRIIAAGSNDPSDDFVLARYVNAAIDLQAASDTGYSDSDNITDDDTPTFDVPVAAPYFRLYRGGSLISGDYESGPYTTPVPSDGVWSYTVTAADEAGNWSGESSALTVTITPIPEPPVLQAASDSGASDTDNITNDNTPTFDVSVAAPYFRVYRSGTPISGLETGTSYTAPVQPDGTWNYAVTEADEAGDESAASAALTVTIDTAAPLAWGLDLNFDDDGKLVMAIEGNDDDHARAVAIQSDGKIVVAGRAYIDGDYQFALARLNADGSLDTSFDGDGKLTTDIGPSDDIANAIAIQSDGRIVVAGEGSGDFALARYNVDGSLDTSFDGDGMITTDFGGNDYAQAVAIQSDGKIVVAGSANVGTYTGLFALARYNADGSLDTTFDGDGKVTTTMGPRAGASALSIQLDGKLVVAGYAYTYGNSDDFALARYNADGSLDTSFDGDGKVITATEGAARAYALAVQANGKIVLAGYANMYGTSNDFALARYNPDGSLDASFDGDGKVTTDIGTSADFAYAMAIQSDGKIVLAGEAYMGGTPYDRNFALARYNADGSLDTSFDGDDGKITTNMGSPYDFAYAMAIQSDGRIVLAGGANITGGDCALARYANAAVDLRSASDTGISDTDNITGDDTPTFAVSVDAPHFRFYRDGSLISDLYESGSSYTTASQPEGTFAYSVSAVDAAGNVSPVSSPLNVTFLYDGGITGQAFGDLNGNGVRDGIEVGVDGWTVELVDSATGVVAATTVTASVDLDADGWVDPANERGQYAFTGLTAGDYEVRQIVPTGWEQTSPIAMLVERTFAAGTDINGDFIIVEFDPTDGNILNSFAGPQPIISAPFQGLAVGPDSLFYVDSVDTVSPVLWELDMETGAVIDSDVLTYSDMYFMRGMAYLDGLLYIHYKRFFIAVWDPATDTLVAELNTTTSATGNLAAAPDLGVLFDTTPTGDIVTIDPATGAILNTFSPGLGALEGGLAYAKGELLAVDDALGEVVHRIDPLTGAPLGSFTLDVMMNVVGLAGDMPNAALPIAHSVTLGPDEIAGDLDFGNLAPAVPADFNGDGLADSLDIDLLFANLGDAAYDLDGDGDADSDDVDFLVHDIFNTEYGDANLDGYVDATDLAIFKAGFGRGAGTWAQGNLNGDGFIDATDLAIFKAFFGFARPAGMVSGTIEGQVWEDLNGNGIQDVGDVGVNGWTMELVDAASGTVVDTQVTAEVDLDSNGTIDPQTEAGLYAFTSVAAGSYIAREVMPPDWTQTVPFTMNGELAVTQVAQDGVDGVDGLRLPKRVAVSPNGRHLYALAANDDALTVFSIDPSTGAIVFESLILDAGLDVLTDASGLAISDDGRHVFVISEAGDALTVFERDDATGNLTRLQTLRHGVDGIAGIDAVTAVAISADDAHVYVVGKGADALAVFGRDIATGLLSQQQILYGSDEASGLLDPRSLTLSGDGAHVYVVSSRYSTLAAFARDAVTGDLTHVQTLSHHNVAGLGGAYGVTVSNDGRYVITADRTSHAVSVFERALATGELTFRAVYANGVDGITGLDDPSAIVFSPDDRYVFVATGRGDGVVAFSRDVVTGEMTFLDRFYCGNPYHLAIGPDGHTLYAASGYNDSIYVMRRGYVDQYTVDLLAGQTATDLNFGNAQLNSLSGQVFDDGNNNAVRDGAEVGVDGWTVEVFDVGQGCIAAAGLTESIDLNGDGVINPATETGLYSFATLLPGDYDVRVIVPASWAQTHPAAMHRVSLDRSDAANLDFGAFMPASISGQVFADRHADGVKSLGDIGVDGWTIELIDVAMGAVLETTTTGSVDLDEDGKIDLYNETGLYTFGHLIAGDYQIRQIARFGWMMTAPVTSVYNLPLAAGENAADLDFGNYGVGDVEGRIFDDLIADGELNAGDVGLDGWTVNLIDPMTNEVIDTTVTASIDLDGNGVIDPATESGWYSFTRLPVARYEVSIALPDGVMWTRPIDYAGDLEFIQVVTNTYGGLHWPSEVVLSSDGRHAYVSAIGDAMSVFSIDPLTGELTLEQHIQATSNNGLYDAMGAAISDDGLDVYVVGDDYGVLSAYRRDIATGLLTLTQTLACGQDGLDGLDSPQGVAVGPGGQYVYTVSDGDGALMVFARDAVTGELTFVQVLRNGVDGVDGLQGSFDLSVSPDGLNVYVSSWDGYANGWSGLTVFGWNGDGQLVHLQTFTDGQDGVDWLRGSGRIAISPDGRHLYAARPGDNAVNLFDRDVVTGELTYVRAWRDGVDGVDGLYGAKAVAVTPDGERVIVGGAADHALAIFDRHTSTGDLWLREVERHGQDGVSGLYGPSSLTVSPNGRFVFVAARAGDTISVFQRRSHGVQVPVVVAANETIVDVDFGVVELASVTGQVFRDDNADGSRNPGETGLNDWTVEVVDSDTGQVVATGTTADVDLNGDGLIDAATETGIYVINRLQPGSFEIRPRLPDSWTQTAPAGMVHTASLDYRDAPGGFDFGAVRLGTIIGRAFDDRDGDGVKDPIMPGVSAEPFLNGATIELVDLLTGQVIATSVTADVDLDGNGYISLGDETGVFVFGGLLSGDYEVRQTVQAGWAQSYPAGAYSVTLAAGEVRDDLLFGNEPAAAEIPGQVFGDLNGNGVRDGSEVGVDGWTVELVDPATGLVIATTTTASVDLDEDGWVDPATERGHYVFTGLVQGNYEVRQIVPAGWEQTSPVGFVERTFAAGTDINGDFVIVEFDPATGVTLNSFAGPQPIISAPFQGLAVGPDSLFYVDAVDTVTPVLWELDMDTGAVIDSDVLTYSDMYFMRGMAYLDGLLYIHYKRFFIAVWDPATDTLVAELNTTTTATGNLAAAPDLGVLFDTTPTGDIVTIDPATGAILNTFSPGLGALEGGLAYAKGELLAVDDALGEVIHRIDPLTGTPLGSFTLDAMMNVVGLAGDMPNPAMPTTHSVTLGPDEIATDLDFGNLAPATPADFNGDGLVEDLDIDLLFANLGDAAYDLDGDGDADTDDVDFLIHDILNTEHGDANLDGYVDATDLAIFKANFGSSGPWANANFNGDGFIDATDLAILKSTFGFARPAEPAPPVGESAPAALTLSTTGYNSLPPAPSDTQPAAEAILPVDDDGETPDAGGRANIAATPAAGLAVRLPDEAPISNPARSRRGPSRPFGSKAAPASLSGLSGKLGQPVPPAAGRFTGETPLTAWLGEDEFALRQGPLPEPAGDNLADTPLGHSDGHLGRMPLDILSSLRAHLTLPLPA